MAPIVQRFHEILIWPLEIYLPERLKPLAGDSDFVGRLSDAVIKESFAQSTTKEPTALWNRLDSFDRHTTLNTDLRYSEFVYFHPFAQRVLYPRLDEKNPALAILERKGICQVKVTLQGDSAVLFDVLRVHLYIFRSQTALLVVEVANTAPLELDTALQFCDQFRRAYAPYFLQGLGGHCPVKVEWIVEPQYPGPAPVESDYGNPAVMHAPVSDPRRRRAPMAAHWRWLIQPLVSADVAAEGAIAVEQLEDDRIPNMSGFGIVDPFAVSRGDFMRICFSDEKGNPDDLPYGHRFMADFEAKFCYDRFWNPPQPPSHDDLRFSRFLCAGYHMAMVSRPWGFGDTILDHFRHHYFQLGLLAHFHRASLLKYSRRLSTAVLRADDPSEPDTWEMVGRVRREFADFINQYWFREISNQEQGKELFQLWSERLGNRELLDQLTREAAAVDGILNQEYEKIQQKEATKLQESTDRLTKALFWLAGLTLVVALLDTELIRGIATNGEAWFIKGNWDEKYREWQHLAWTMAAIGGVSIAGLVAVYLMWYPRSKKEGRGAGKS